jgi:CRISPR system Cascade subunit CasB
MTDPKPHRPWFWERFDPREPYAGVTIADLYRGLGEPSGTVPSIWRYHRSTVRDLTVQRGLPDWGLTAEHHALTLFALHQQSQSRSMHARGVGLGTALRKLRLDPNTSSDAVDLQVKALVTADDTEELYEHLRAVVPRLKRLKDGAQGLDYTSLYWNLYHWNDHAKRTEVRRAWGAQYADWGRTKTPPAPAPDAAPAPEPQ